MKKTMLTYGTLDRFEKEYITDGYSEKEIERIEHCAYVANMNTCAHPEWTEEDVFSWFLYCVVDIYHISVEKKPTAAELVEQIAQKVEQTKTRSAWSKGVKNYAEWLVDDLRDGVDGGWIDLDSFSNRGLLEKAMLNGARNWNQYSEGGCARIYDYDIAYALCTPSEFKRTGNGRKAPNAHESWIDVQSRALYQAAQLILSAAF